MSEFTGFDSEGNYLYRAYLSREKTRMGYREIRFDVSQTVLDYGVHVIVLAMNGLHNREGDPEFDHIVKESIQNILAGLSVESIRDDPILQGFRKLHTTLGFSNRNFPAASEPLLEYLLKNRSLPKINLLVDLYNLVSVETRLALGAHDIARITGNVHLRQPTGTEKYVPLGALESKPVRPSGYAYVDDANEVICLLEVKQVEKTKVTVDTTDCFFIIQGNAQTEIKNLRSAADRLVSLTQRFCGGQARFLYRG